MLPPRMTTTQRDAIATPAEGLVIFNTSTDKINYFDGVQWAAIPSSGNSLGLYLLKSQDETNYDGTVASSSAVQFETVDKNTFTGTNPWNSTSGLFTAPFSGHYSVSGSLLSNAADLHQVWLVVNGGRTITLGYFNSGIAILPFSGVTYLNAGDTMGIHSYSISNSMQHIRANTNHTFMSIVFLGWR